LAYLNVNTRTSYLARIRNPNPKMPDAQRIGVASLAKKESTEKVKLDYDKGTLEPKTEKEPNGH
jgi:hypothetical protein